MAGASKEQLRDGAVRTAEIEAKPLPMTARGRRSRQALLDAANEVFARDGFADARITDIADTAKAAHGSFYTYFSSKEEIFVALLKELEEDLRSPAERNAEEPAESEDGQARDPYESILRANKAYLTAYRQHAAIMIVWEQVATLNAGVEDLRREASDRFAGRIESVIRHWQETGVADPALEPEYAALALTGMVSNFVYRWSARGSDYTLDKAAEQLSLLWANSLGVRVPGNRA
ncbi:TetR/AcrR family transcriptional regulator [Amycolatopsis sp. K13G38]|uniref:TetR/AcrR family transcriptional regulator n=1 Tax=Amycolatopsis acididurans TaxID=2724524 RepID=A0ABX1J4I4_9PSEU|nr:TetR/AcrR family transcriptional regulator [Amycolatopsis acididurans]NKQ54707.1 TetR/AcrR family transcriptional regulator [Amycolatopsis acididurans]